MSKGLEALKEQFELLGIKSNPYLKTIEKELKDKEKFEELVNMDLDLFMKAVDVKGLIEDYQTFKKALEIIKTKRVNCFLLIAVMRTSDNLEHYNQNYGKDFSLTQEEYDFLKEVML